MAKASRQKTSSAPFPFVRQFTAPPFFVDIDDAKRKSQLLLDAVQHAGPLETKAPVKRKAVAKSSPKRKVAPARKGGAKKQSGKKR